MHPKPEILLFGDDEGTAGVAEELGVVHVPEVARNEYGTPLISDVFEKAQRLATHNLLCYVNADIILMSDFARMIERVSSWSEQFLIAGRRWGAEITEPWDFYRPDWEEGLRQYVKQTGTLNAWGIDYFLFPRGLYSEIPPLAIGRGFFDGVLIRTALAVNAPVIDATSIVMAVHQNHGSGKPEDAHAHPMEIWRNYVLAGGCRHWFLFEATHKLTVHGLKRARGQKFLFLCKSLARELFVYRTGFIRHRLGLRRANLRRIKHFTTWATAEPKQNRRQPFQGG